MKKIIVLMLFFIFGMNLSYAYNTVGRQVVRSAEYAVIERCYGELILGAPDGSDESDLTSPCEHTPENIIDMNNIKQESVTLDGQTYTFTLNPYYMDDLFGVADMSVAKLLNDSSANGFIQSILSGINRMKEIEVDGERKIVHDEKATNQAREKAFKEFEAFVNKIRAQYKDVKVFYKTVYVRNDLLGDIDNMVFATKNNELVAIETNEDKNVFYAGNGVVIEEVRDTMIYTADNYFYLCEDNSTCDKCDALVAYGTWQGMKYFSRYCDGCACFFVWDATVDSTNPIKEEGLKCIRRAIGSGSYCGTHKCRACSSGIVGVSRVGEPFDDIRVTGNAYLANYSYYCVGHKCRAVMCRTIRGGNDTTASDPLDETELRSPLYCGAHNKGCHYMIYDDAFCGDPVTKSSYQDSGFRMLCESHKTLGEKLLKSPNAAMPILTTCLRCGGVDVSYWYGDNGGLCSPCLNDEYNKAKINMCKLAAVLTDMMLQNGENPYDKQEVDNYAKYGSILSDFYNFYDYNSSLENLPKVEDAFLTYVRNQNSEIMRFSGDKYKNDPRYMYGPDYDNYTFALSPDCVDSGIIPLAMVADNWGLELKDGSGKNLLKLAERYIVSTDSGTFEIATVGSYDEEGSFKVQNWSCANWNTYVTGGDNSLFAFIDRGDNTEDFSASEYVDFLKSSMAVNNHGGDPYHTRYPAGVYTFIHPLTGCEVEGALVHNVTRGSIIEEETSLARAEAYVCRQDENGYVFNDDGEIILDVIRLAEDENNNLYIPGPDYVDNLPKAKKGYKWVESENGDVRLVDKETGKSSVKYVKEENRYYPVTSSGEKIYQAIAQDCMDYQNERYTYTNFYQIRGATSTLAGWEESVEAHGFALADPTAPASAKKIIKNEDGTYSEEIIIIPKEDSEEKFVVQ